MQDREYVLSGPENIVISSPAAKKILAGKDPDCALLYIYILSSHGVFSKEKASNDLNMPLERVMEGMRRLYNMGLVSAVKNPTGDEKKRLEPADELPEYSISDIKREIDEGSVFSSLVRDVQRSLGKKLSSEDLVKLFGIYDGLGMPPEVILILIIYCKDEYQRKYGPGRNPTMRFIQKAAFSWEREEILTPERAERHILQLEKRRKGIGEVKYALKIRDRELTETEKKYILSWLSMGFSVDAIELAYDRTVINTGKLAWNYMNSILKNWHEKGLHGVSEIEKNDGKKPEAPKAMKDDGKKGNIPQGSPTGADLLRMQKLLENIKGE